MCVLFGGGDWGMGLFSRKTRTSCGAVRTALPAGVLVSVGSHHLRRKHLIIGVVFA